MAKAVLMYVTVKTLLSIKMSGRLQKRVTLKIYVTSRSEINRG